MFILLLKKGRNAFVQTQVIPLCKVQEHGHVKNAIKEVVFST